MTTVCIRFQEQKYNILKALELRKPRTILCLLLAFLGVSVLSFFLSQQMSLQGLSVHTATDGHIPSSLSAWCTPIHRSTGTPSHPNLSSQRERSLISQACLQNPCSHAPVRSCECNHDSDALTPMWDCTSQRKWEVELSTRYFLPLLTVQQFTM